MALLNAARHRSEATILAPLTETDLINALLLERRMEILGEGLQNFDQMRLLQTIPKNLVISGRYLQMNYHLIH